ncbi:MAG: DnaJ domain-containing protein [Fimbriimonadales bacterium]
MDADGAYALLGVAPGASDEELRDAYRHRVREVHPDLAQPANRLEAEGNLRDVIDAYQYLSNPPAPVPAAVVASLIEEPLEQESEPEIDEDDCEIRAAIYGLLLAAALYGSALWLFTTHVMPRGISAQTTAYSFIGLFVLWGVLYGVLAPTLKDAARRKATRKP